MSQQAQNWFVEQYNDRVAHVYQASGNLLRGTVSAAGSIRGTKAYFMVAGKGTARKKVRGQPAVPMNAGRTRKELILETWEAFDEVYEYDLSRLSVDEREAISVQGAKALGRATDLEIMTKAYGVAPTAGNRFLDLGATAFSAAYAITACQRLQQADVPWDGDVFCPLPSLPWNQLLANRIFNNADYTGPELSFLKATTAKSWNGVHWFLAPDEYFTSVAANTVDVMMWHKSALGWANNKDVTSVWQWDNRAGCWTVRMENEGAAGELLEGGLVRMRIPTNTPIAVV